LLARIPRFVVLFCQARHRKRGALSSGRPEQATDIGNAIVIPVNLATPIHPPRLDSKSSLMSGTSVGHAERRLDSEPHSHDNAGYDDRDDSLEGIAMCPLDASTVQRRKC